MPYRIVVIRTTLSPSEVEAKLRSITRARPSFLARLTEPGADARFEGEVEATHFRITRVIGYRNSFLPVISGTLEQANGGTTVCLRMHLHPFVAAFSLIWFGTLLGVLLSLLSPGWPGAVVAAVPLGLLLFGGVLVSACFFPESFKAEQLLRRALRAA